MKEKIAIYPGSFDPITNGHLDILSRALNAFDKIIILVAVNPYKKSRFSYQDRVAMIKEAVKGFANVEVDYYDGLTVNYAKSHGAHYLIRGLRAVTDFEYEFQLAATNQYVSSEIDSVFFMARGENANIASSMIMELHANGVDVSNLVPPAVLKYLK